MTMRSSARSFLLAGWLLLGGCRADPARKEDEGVDDPAIAQALDDPIMSDPDLSGQNDAGPAIAIQGMIPGGLPPLDRRPETIAAIKAEAARLAGTTLPALPPAEKIHDLLRLRDAETAAQMARAAGVSAECAQAAGYTLRWAAQLPAPFQIYPRGAVQEAAGTDRPGCVSRMVHFLTPAEGEAVAAFYFAWLRAGGYSVSYGADGADRTLRGRKGASAYILYIRPADADTGLTAVDLAVTLLLNGRR